MKRLIKNSIYVVIILAVLFAASRTFEGSPALIQGDSAEEKVSSLANVVNSDSKGHFHLEFLEYDKQNNTWEFTLIYLEREMSEVLIRGATCDEAIKLGAPEMGEYCLLLKRVFLETSKIIPEEQQRISMAVLFKGLVGVVESTDKSLSIRKEPDDLWLYMNELDRLVLMPESKLRELLRKAMPGPKADP